MFVTRPSRVVAIKKKNVIGLVQNESETNWLTNITELSARDMGVYNQFEALSDKFSLKKSKENDW